MGPSHGPGPLHDRLTSHIAACGFAVNGPTAKPQAVVKREPKPAVGVKKIKKGNRTVMAGGNLEIRRGTRDFLDREIDRIRATARNCRGGELLPHGGSGIGFELDRGAGMHPGVLLDGGLIDRIQTRRGLIIGPGDQNKHAGHQNQRGGQKAVLS